MSVYQYVYLIVTSQSCPHCVRSRGNGNLDNGFFFMESSLIKQIIKSKKVLLVNVHFYDMSATGVMEYSKFTLEGDKVREDKYSAHGDDTKHEIFLEGVKIKDLKKTNQREYNRVKPKLIAQNFNKFVSEVIPIKIRNFINFFPAFILFKGDDLQKAISDKNFQLLGLLSSHYTKRKTNGEYSLSQKQRPPRREYKQNEGKEAYIEELVGLVEDVLSGKEKFKEHEKEDGFIDTQDTSSHSKDKSQGSNEVNKQKKIILEDYSDYYF